MAITKTATKKTMPRKKPAAPKKAPAAKRTQKQATKAAGKPAAKAKKDELVDETPQKDAAIDECAKGGTHEWTDDDTGRFCSKCLEPAATEQAGAPKAASAKNGRAAKNVAKETVAGPKKEGKTGKQTGYVPQSQLELDEVKKLEASREKKTAAKAKKPSERKTSAIDAAAKVLAESAAPMAAKQMIDAMATKGYWKSPGGKTPHATLYAAILRELQTKGKDARFQKVERGKFALAK